MSVIQSLHKIGRAASYASSESVLRLPGRPATAINQEIVVSLTTFPARINSVWKTLETLYRQSLAPREVVLVLSVDEFPDKKLPNSVSRFFDRGLRVKYVHGNVRSYKKLLPLLDECSDKIIVTADDDVLYPRHWLQQLERTHQAKPGHIIGHRGTRIIANGEAVAPYVDWPQADTRTPSNNLFLTGVGGILYPPGSLSDQVMDIELAFRLCPTADDIWFKAMALICETPTTKVSDALGDFVTVREVQSSSLRTVNVFESGNDHQFQAVMNHFSLWDKLS